nr:MAG TPA: putative RNA polymerase [Caudoviricetes sp.]
MPRPRKETLEEIPLETKKKPKKKRKPKRVCTEEELQEYKEIEDLVMNYQKQFLPEATYEDRVTANDSGEELLERFVPLFRKYLTLICAGKIDFGDPEMKQFIGLFICDPSLKRALGRKNAATKFVHSIHGQFNFVVETYGKQPEEDILVDLQMLLLTLAKRYKQMGRNFCGYVYNSFRFEVFRHIAKFTKNPANIHYRKIEYEDYMQIYQDEQIEECFEDKIYENSLGIPDLTWINGETCSDIFLDLTKIERKLIIKYYLEDYNDRQISELYSMHTSTVNLWRRRAIKKVALALGMDPDKIKRSRRSGKMAILANYL